MKQMEGKKRFKIQKSVLEGLKYIKGSWENGQLRLYNRLSSWELTKYMVWKIRKRYEMIKPASEKTVILGTMKILNICLLAVGLLSGFAVTLWGASIYTYMIWFSLLFMVTSQIISENLRKEEYKLLVQLERYLGDVRHYYHIGGMIEEAVYDSLEDAPYEISLHIQKIYEVLGEEEESEKYKAAVPNKYLKAFLALCQITVEYGDTLHDGKSLFLINLNHLRSEIHVELLKRDKIRYTFSGLVFLTVLPVFFLKVIEDFSISNLPELEKYYHGRYGIVVSVVIFLTTVFAYVLISSLKEDGKVIKSEHLLLQHMIQLAWIKQHLERYFFKKPAKTYSYKRLLREAGSEMSVSELLVQKQLLLVGTVLISLMICLNISMTERHNAVYEVNDFKGTTLVSQKEEIEEYKKIIRAGAIKYKDEKNLERIGQEIKSLLKQKGLVKEDSMAEALCEEILARIVRYQNSGFHWYYLLYSMLAGGVVCQAPVFLLEIKRYFLKSAIEDEVMQFQTMIVMLMYIPRMNVEIILEWLESFSDIFKQSVWECMDLYYYDDERALNELKEKEPFPSFVRLIEDLQACDRVGIEAAFDGVAGQREYFLEKRKQDNEIQISDKGVIGKIAAYMPMTLVIGLYLIVPFVLESLSQLNGYMIQMEIF